MPESNWSKHTGLKDPTCALKFGWSTIRLSEGTTNGCHRTDSDEIIDFKDFHNTPIKVKTRKEMLAGVWPKNGCEYCHKIEDAGGISDRMQSNNSPKTEHFSTNSCTMLEVYFSNLCNQACVYCSPEYSSTWEAEHKKFGLETDIMPWAKEFLSDKNNYKRILAEFWEWMEDNHQGLVKYNILGGEPFYQPELEQNLDFFEDHPMPNCELSIFTNLKVRTKKFVEILDRLRLLEATNHIGRVRIVCSIDSWGDSFEYIRWGGHMDEWLRNYETLKQYDFVVPEIHMTINALSIKQMPDLVELLNNYSYTYVSANFVVWPFHMAPDIFPKGFFKEDFARLYKALDEGFHYKEDLDIFKGYEKSLDNTPVDYKKINTLKEDLTAIDLRRGCDWKKTFPWLDEYDIPNILSVTI